MVAGWRHPLRKLAASAAALQSNLLPPHGCHPSLCLFPTEIWARSSAMRIWTVGNDGPIVKPLSSFATGEWCGVPCLDMDGSWCGRKGFRSYSHDSSYSGDDRDNKNILGLDENLGKVDTGHRIVGQFQHLAGDHRSSATEWAACARHALKNVDHLDPGSMATVLRLCSEAHNIDMGLMSALLSKLVCYEKGPEVHKPGDISELVRSLGLIVRHLKRTNQTTLPDGTVFLGNCDKIVSSLVTEALSMNVFLSEACEVNSLVDTVYGLGLLCHFQACKMNQDARQLVGIILGELYKRDNLALLSLSQLSHIFYACAAMTYKHFGVFRDLCMKLEVALNASSTSSCSMQTLKYSGETDTESCRNLSTATLASESAVKVLWAMGVLHFRIESTLGLILKCIDQNTLILTGEQVTMCFEGLYKLDYWPTDTVQPLASRLSTRLILRGLLDEELVSVLGIFSQYSFKDMAILNAIWLELGQSNRLPHLENELLLSIMESFWKLGFRKPGVWEILGNEIRVLSRALTISSADVGLLMLAFGKAGYHHYSLIRYLSEEFCSESHLEAFEDIDMVNVCYGLALAGCKDTALLGTLAMEVSKPLRLHNFGEDHLSSLVYSFGRLGYRSKRVFDELAWEVCKPERLQALSEHNLSNILWGFAKVRYYNKEIVDAIIIEGASNERLPRYTDQGLSNVVYSIGRLNYKNLQVLTSLGMEVARKERLETFTAQAISNIAFAFGKLDFPFVPFMRALERELSKPGRFEKFRGLEISNLMYALGKMAFPFPGAIENVQTEASKEGRLRRFTGPELANLAFGFSGMRYYVRPALEAFLEEVMKPERIREFSDSELHSITVKLDDLQVVSSSVLDYFAKELTDRYDLAQDWDYPIFIPWKGQWLFHPPFPPEEDATEEEVDELLRKFAKVQQEQEAQEKPKRARWSSIKL